MSLTGLVLGVANQRSLAWYSAKSLIRSGKFKRIIVTSLPSHTSKVQKLIAEYDEDVLNGVEVHHLECDVTCKHSMMQVFECYKNGLPSLLKYDDEGSNASSEDDLGHSKLDCIVHSLAYAPASTMKDADRGLLSCSKEDFDVAHRISAYSLIEVTRRSLPYLNSPSSIVAMSYLGASRAVPNYNIMGPAKASLEAISRGLALELGKHDVRVNCVSAGPVNTLSARGIRDFSSMKKEIEKSAPLRRNVSPDEVGSTVAFLASEISSGITGQTIYVDSGFSVVSG